MEYHPTKTTKNIPLRRVNIVSSKPFDDVVGRLTSMIGHTDVHTFHEAVAHTTTLAELEAVVRSVVGASDLMEFFRFDSGDVLRKAPASSTVRLLRLLVGNPLIMRDMASRVPDAAAYAPVTILIAEREDGVHLSFDSMASLIATYGDDTALTVAIDLDTKVESLLYTAAEST